MQSRPDNIYVSAGFFPRATAFIIDCLLVGVVTFFIKITSFFICKVMGNSLPHILFNFDAIDITCYIITTAYFVIITGLTGTTLGKKVMKLKVIGSDGSAVSLFDALYRETVGRYLTSILYIGYIVAACDSKHRGFHDMLADTMVVYDLARWEQEPVVKQDIQPY